MTMFWSWDPEVLGHDSVNVLNATELIIHFNVANYLYD